MPRRLLAYYTPDQLSGLVCWLKADALSLGDGDAVASWTDSSANSNTPVQATAANKPTYISNQINALPVIRFDGNDGLVMPVAANFSLATPTIFVIARRTSGSSIMGKSTTSFGDARRRKMGITTGSGSLAYSSGSDSQSIGVTATTANFNMFGVSTISDSVHSLFLNGTQTDSTVALGDSTTNTAPMIIGSNFSVGTEAFVGDIAEIVIYSRPLASIEVVGLQNYLSAKYNLPVTQALGGVARTAVSGRKLLPKVATRTFNGSSDYVDVGTLGTFGTSLNTDGLCAFCFTMRTSSTSNRRIFGTSNGSVNTALLINANANSGGTTTSNKMNVFIRNGSNSFQNVGTTNTFNLADGKFHTYVIQRVSRYTWEIWQDGVSLAMTNPSASGDLSSGFLNFTNPFGIGASNTGSWGSYIAADLHNVGIYQRSLTSAEISAYNSGTFPSNAFRIFTLTDGDKNVAVDMSANSVNGTITGAILFAPRALAGSGIAG